eukprot:gene4647-8220_t
MKLLFALVIVILATALSKESYRGDQVLRFNLTTQLQINELQKLEEQQHVDLWSEQQGFSQIDVRIPKNSLKIVDKALFKKYNIKYRTIVKDVQDLIDREEHEMKNRIIYDPLNKNTHNEFFKNFRTIEEINEWLKKHAENSKLVKLISAGKTYEGRDILGIRIRGKKNKPITLHHGAIHAREWIAPSTVMYMANELITKYETDPSIKWLVDNIEWHFFPVLNVDGYKYTHTNSRLWRKTRRPNPGSTCIGTDPNRNFGFKWNSGGSSSSPCSQTFHGSKAWSEKCTESIANYGKSLLPRLKGYVDWHCYGQLFMRPYGWTRNIPEDEPAMKKIGDAASEAIGKVRGKRYRSGRFSSILYMGSGVSVDYFYGEHKVFSYTPELGTSFTMPASEIVPIGKEIFEGLKVYGKLLVESVEKE